MSSVVGSFMILLLKQDPTVFSAYKCLQHCVYVSVCACVPVCVQLCTGAVPFSASASNFSCCTLCGDLAQIFISKNDSSREKFSLSLEAFSKV